MQTGVQQIMLGTVTGNEAAARETLSRIRAAGFDGIELNAFMVHPTSLGVRLMTKAAGMPVGKGGGLDWPALLSEAGLGTISLHTDLAGLLRDPDVSAKEAARFGTDRLVITGMYRFDYTSAEAVKGLCRDLNTAGAALKERGLRLFYHNHNAELVRMEDGCLAYDRILEDTDPDLLDFELDSFWMAEAGADPLAYMRRLKGRLGLYHITDRGTRKKGPFMTPILSSDSLELGTGAMNLPALLEAAEASGAEAVVLETHKNWIDKDPLRSLEQSGRWLQAHLEKTTA